MLKEILSETAQNPIFRYELLIELSVQKANQLDFTYNVLYNLAMPKKLVALRVDPIVWKKARIAALVADKPLGDWIKEAINEKLKREEKHHGDVAKKTS